MKSNHYSRLFSEILHDPRFSMEERRFNASASLVMANLQNGITLEFEPKTMARIVALAPSADGKVADMSIDFTCAAEMQAALQGDAIPQDNVFINSIYICGTMTREGDACTYGSKEHKEMMMDAADDPRCRGHIMLINSGGGAVGTLMDYRDAINYCLERGQNVVAVVEECAASAACFTANMTNRIFVTRDTDEVGSLGMFAVFTTIADGTVIPQTNEVVHIRYAEQSKDKNYAFREAADGNLKPIDKMLKEDLAEVLSNTKKDRNCLLDEQLTGKMYKARDVMGSMVDEIGDMDAAVNWLMDDWNSRNGAPLPVKATADEPDPKPTQNDPAAPVNEPEPKDPNNEPDPNEGDGNASNVTQPQTINNPMKQYTAIPSAIGEEPMETLGELTLQEHQADALEQAITASQNRIAELEASLAAAQQQATDASAAAQASIDELNAAHAQQVEALNAEHQQALDAVNAEVQTRIDNLNAEHASAIETINAEHAAAIEALNADHAAIVATLNESTAAAHNSLAYANEQLLAATQRVNDLTAEVESLNNAQGNQPQAGQQPVSNGQQPAQQATIVTSQYAYDPTLSAKENAERRKKAMGK